MTSSSSSISSTASRRWLSSGMLRLTWPSLSLAQVEEGLDRADAAPGGVRGERVVGPAVVAGGAVGQDEDHVGAEHQPGVRPVGDQPGPPLGIADRGEALGRRQLVELARTPGVRSHGVRLKRPKSMPMPRAVVCGRTSAALAVLLLGELDDLRVQVGPAVRLDEPVAHRPARAPADLAHHRDLGAGLGQRLVVPLAEAHRALEEARAGAPQHVAEREQLVRAGPRARHGTAVGHHVAERAARRDARGPPTASPPRPSRTCGRCPRACPSPRSWPARPSPPRAARSGRRGRRR